MANLKIAIGERLNVEFRQYLIFNDQKKTYFKKSMNNARAYDFMKALKMERITPEESQKRTKKYKCVHKLDFTFK